MRRSVLAATLLFTSALAGAEPVDLTLPTTDGSTLSLSSLRGRWVVVNVWATWCSPCIKELPELAAFHAEHKGKDATVVGVAYENTTAGMLSKFIEPYKLGYPVMMAGTTPLPGFPKMKGVPTTFIINPKGELVRTYTGPVTAAGVELLIDDLRQPARPPAAINETPTRPAT